MNNKRSSFWLLPFFIAAGSTWRCITAEAPRCNIGYTEQELLKPGETYEDAIDLLSLSQITREGQRIQLEASNSSIHEHNRNLNTGRGADAALRFAHQTVLYAATYPSHILLPVVH